MTNFICPECLEEDERILEEGGVCPECEEYFNNELTLEDYQNKEGLI